jgi:hypothetical protein
VPETIAEPRRRDSAEVLANHFCKACGWPIIFVCCNDGMGEHPPFAGNDWWYYCANKTCQHHTGEGVFQSQPEWQHEVKEPELSAVPTIYTAIGKDLDDLGEAYGCRLRASGESDQSYREAIINRVGNPKASAHVVESAMTAGCRQEPGCNWVEGVSPLNCTCPSQTRTTLAHLIQRMAGIRWRM